MCPPFWITDPRILVKDPGAFFPFTQVDSRCTAAALNSFTRFGIYLGVLLAIISWNMRFLWLGAAFAACTVVAWFVMQYQDTVREQFASGQTRAPVLDARTVDGRYVPDALGYVSSDYRRPTLDNPFMNVLLTDLPAGPGSLDSVPSNTAPLAPASNVDSGPGGVGAELDRYFQTQFTSDPTDIFQRSQSQRQWVTMPSSTVPNDQDSFQNWLYRVPGQTCREGNMNACFPDTGPATLPWRELQQFA